MAYKGKVEGYGKRHGDNQKTRNDRPNVKVFNISTKASREDPFVGLTGVFANFNDNGEVSSFSVSVREDLTIPAGTTLFVFDEIKGGCIDREAIAKAATAVKKD